MLQHTTQAQEQELFANDAATAEIKELLKAMGIGTADPAPKPEKRMETKVGVKVPRQALAWTEPGYGSIKIFAANGAVSPQTVRSGLIIFTAVKPEGMRPNSLRIVYGAKAEEKVQLYRVTAKKLDRCEKGKAVPLHVKIEWEGDVPKLRRETHDENFVFLREDGSFVQLEVAVVTRKARDTRGFYLLIQEVFRGKFVRAANGEVLFVPTTAANAYPGVNYARSAVGAKFVLDAAAASGSLAEPNAACSAAWTGTLPVLHETLLKQGYKPGVVLWYNASMGGGKILLEGGDVCFAHMSAVLDDQGRPTFREGGFPLLHPLRQVAVRSKKGEKGLAATAVRYV